MTKTIYNQTAAELHDDIVRDLLAYCEHNRLDVSPLETADQRPLEQTIRLVIAAALDAAVGAAFRETDEFEKSQLRRL